MANEAKTAAARKTYNTICAALDNRGWNYSKIEDRLAINFTVKGDDLPMEYVIFVDADRQLIRVLSRLPFAVKDDKIMDMAIACCVATYGLVDGSFDLDPKSKCVIFRLTVSFLGSEIGEGLFSHIIDFSDYFIDLYNDRLFAVNEGFISVNEFIEKENQ